MDHNVDNHPYPHIHGLPKDLLLHGTRLARKTLGTFSKTCVQRSLGLRVEGSGFREVAIM